MEIPKLHPPAIRSFFFWTGICATLAYRIIILLNSVSILWGQIAWYVGTIGFIAYFLHRFQIARRRSKLISYYKLDTRIEENSSFTDNEKAALLYIITTLKSTREKWNYVFIFVVSGIALIGGLYLDFFR